MTHEQIKIVYWGGPEFSIPAFEALFEAGHELIVITTPDKPTGRKKTITPPPLKLAAQKRDVSFIQPRNIKTDEMLKNTLKNLKPDVFVVAAYGKIIPKEYLTIPVYGALNIHPSLLPKYRGPTPIQTAILNGDTETGTTIILMDEETDHGPIIKSRELGIKNQGYLELYKELSESGTTLLIEILPDWIDGKIKPQPQNDSKATYTKKFILEDGKINWSKTATEIGRQIRALNPEPGTWTKWNDKALKIPKAEIIKEPVPPEIPKKSGLVAKLNTKTVITASSGAIAPKIVQLEGKKPLSIQEFINGNKNFIGSVLL